MNSAVSASAPAVKAAAVERRLYIRRTVVNRIALVLGCGARRGGDVFEGTVEFGGVLVAQFAADGRLGGR